LRLLLDTHTLIWNYQTDQRMSATAIAMIQDQSNEILVSPASYWEIAIKLGTGKYIFAEPFGDFIEHAIIDNGFTILPVEPRHTEQLIGMKPYHKDPFDRLLIAQSMAEGVSILSADAAFDQYPIRRIW